MTPRQGNELFSIINRTVRKELEDKNIPPVDMIILSGAVYTEVLAFILTQNPE